MDESTGLVRRDTIEDVVRARNGYLAQMEEAHERLEMAQSALSEASVGVHAYHSGRAPVYESAAAKCLHGLQIDGREKFLADATRYIDTQMWGYLIDLTGLEVLMDRTAKEELEAALTQNPPPIEHATIEATLKHQIAQSREYFLRGLATSFSYLDRRFKSHDGWKLGSRMILTNAFNEFGSWCYHGQTRAALIDVERVFFVLTQTPQPHTSPVVHAINESRKGLGWGARQSECETELFKVRCFKNGNLHLWFKRRDLMDRVNTLLAEYYGEVLSDGDEADTSREDLNTTRTSLARNYGFYPTPHGTASEVFKLVWRGRFPNGLRVLEPSAGTGHLAYPLSEDNDVDCVEIQPDLAHDLDRSGKFGRVWCADFLALPPSPVYDLVVMNPPFDRGRDIDHVLRAFEWLKPGGSLVSVMSAGTEVRDTKKARAFRSWVKAHQGRFWDLPERSFASVGTNVNTIVCKVSKRPDPSRAGGAL